MLWSIYLRDGLVYLPTMAMIRPGFHMGIEPVEVVAASDTNALEHEILRVLGRGNPRVPAPKRARFPPPAVLKHTTLKSWSAFERGARTWKIVEKDGQYQIRAGRRRHDRGWEDDPEGIEDMPPGATIEYVAKRAAAIVRSSLPAKFARGTAEDSTRKSLGENPNGGGRAGEVHEGSLPGDVDRVATAVPNERLPTLWCVYLREGTAYIPTVARSDAGYCISVNPVEIVSAANAGELRLAIERVFVRGNQQASVPPPDEAPNLARCAGVESWSAFIQGTRTWKIIEKDGVYEVTQSGLSSGKDIRDEARRTMRLTVSTSLGEAAERVAALVRAAADEAGCPGPADVLQNE